MAPQQFRVPIGLEVRIETLSVLVDLILVGVDQADSRLAANCFGYLKKRVWGQLVIMLQQGDEFARSQGESTV
jgi:hypothetical protein